MDEQLQPRPSQADRKLDDANKRVEAAKALDEADKIATKTQVRGDMRKAL